MPRLKLLPHSNTPQPAIFAMWATIARRPGGYLTLSYYATGAMDEIAWPGTAASGFGPWRWKDGLWRRSCFEVFGAIAGERGYFEVNLVPSDEWAAYGFSSYRTGMRAAVDIDIVSANWRIRPRKAECHAMLQLPAAYSNVEWRLGLSAVIEARNHRKSYWALAHGPGQPDFHNPDCFIVSVPAPAAP